jgi:hypothetical protein
MTPNLTDDTLRRAADYLRLRGTERIERPGQTAAGLTDGPAPQRRRLRLIVGGAMVVTVAGGTGLAAALTGALPVFDPFNAGDAPVAAQAPTGVAPNTERDDSLDVNTAAGATATTTDASPTPGDNSGASNMIRLSPNGSGSVRPADPVLGDPTTPDPGTGDGGPVISDVVTSQTVTAGTPLRVSWTVNGASPASNPWMLVGGASGWVPWCGFPTYASLIGGSDDNLRFEALCDVPTTVPDGTLTVFIGAVDDFGNRSEVTVDVTIVGGSSDGQAPVVSEVSLSSTNTTPGARVVVRWRAGDETGVADTYPMVAGPNGHFVNLDTGEPWSAFTVGTLVSGTPTNGIYEAVVDLSPNAIEGTYSLWFGARDGLGNRMFEQAANGERGYGTFTVVVDDLIRLPVIR